MDRVSALSKSKRTISRDDSLEYFIKFPSASVYSEPIIEATTSTAAAAASDINTNTDTTFPIIHKESNVSVVLLLGWAGCQDRYLMKYSKIYEDRGLITVRYTAPLDNIFWNRNALGPLGHKILKLLIEMNFDEHPVIVHVFSNGGAYLYHQILLAMKQTNAQINIRGLIFDSAPGERRLMGLYRATSTIYGSCCMAWLITFTIIAAWTFESLIKRVVFYFQSIPYEEVNPYLSLMNDDKLYPQLILYSQSDKLIPYQDIERFALHRKDLGAPAEAICFENAEHVKLYMEDPDKYVQAITKFINDCLANGVPRSISEKKND